MSAEAEKYVRAMAAQVSLPIAEEHLPGTVANFERSAALAKLLMEFPLSMDVQPAPTYEP